MSFVNSREKLLKNPKKNYTECIIRIYHHLCGKLCGKCEQLRLETLIFTKNMVIFQN